MVILAAGLLAGSGQPSWSDELVDAKIRADMLARDHVFSALDNRTVDQALEAGVPTKEIWRAVCDAFEVPPERR
jgi:hypothetical protein